MFGRISMSSPQLKKGDRVKVIRIIEEVGKCEVICLEKGKQSIKRLVYMDNVSIEQ